MFRKKMLRIFENFAIYIYNNKPNVSSHKFALALRHHSSQKTFVFNSPQINGFPVTFSLKRNFKKVPNNIRHMSEFLDLKCWNCKKNLELKEFVCASCGILQHPKPKVNFFELLGISQVYDLDMEDLTKKFRNKQMIFHPDKFANKSKKELEISEEYSMLLNKAYSTLKDPLARGFYLLELQNISKESVLPMEQEFLIAIMEKNEKLENLNNLNSLHKFLENNAENIAKEISSIKDAFQTSKWEEAKLHLLKLNYYINLHNKIKDKQSKINLSKH